ncbi:hypothetical protein T492DRAFT_834887 [Pavlovales sp. CCMP2436]|nr:hypothetical protein T492DRAFT_834887 [Pavlovales sp. CCMP2436]
MQEDSFKRNVIDLARASYLPLDQAGTFGDTLGFTLDRQLSQADTHVYIDNRTGQPTIVHRGSTSPRDFLVDDALIAFGSGRETQRQRRAREITTAAEAKYNKPSNSTGHSLGGRLAERSGSRGTIVTFNKAAGLGDIPSFNFTGRSQPQIQNGSRQTDSWPSSIRSSPARGSASKRSGEPFSTWPSENGCERAESTQPEKLEAEPACIEYHPGSSIGNTLTAIRGECGLWRWMRRLVRTWKKDLPTRACKKRVEGCITIQPRRAVHPDEMAVGSKIEISIMRKSTPDR